MRKTKINSQYNVAAADTLPIKIAAYQRKRMFREFIDNIPEGGACTILDVGATSDQSYEASNYLEAWYPDKDAITAVGLDDANFLVDKYPGIKFVRANGLQLPFHDRSFTAVHASAVLEHVGCFENQVRFIEECARVSSDRIFLTTPNRWFPVEFHTVLPLVHWLPKRWFRYLLSLIGMRELALEKNLNLMDSSELYSAASRIEGYEFRVYSVALLGWPSNLLLYGYRV